MGSNRPVNGASARPLENRVQTLSFRHHYEVASQPATAKALGVGQTTVARDLGFTDSNESKRHPKTQPEAAQEQQHDSSESPAARRHFPGARVNFIVAARVNPSSIINPEIQNGLRIFNPPPRLVPFDLSAHCSPHEKKDGCDRRP
jgi:hypothetical protein